MPYWRSYKNIFNKGVRKSWLSLVIIAAVYSLALFSSIEFTIPIAILSMTVLLTANTLFITKSVDLFSLVVSCLLLLTALSVGWMWIVVGWPLLIFLALLVQVYLFTNPD